MLSLKLKKLCINKIYPEIAQNVNRTNYKRNCLIVYIKGPFQLQMRMKGHTHQNVVQLKEIARQIGNFGYNVDVIDYNNTSVKLKKKYDLVLDICPREHPVYERNLTEGSIRIAYLTGSNSVFTNNAENQRINELYLRKGVKLVARRQAQIISKDIEQFDAFFFIGNRHNLETFSEFHLPPVYYMPNTGYKYNFDITRLIKKGIKRKNAFLYLGGSGAVHKGLDLVLEVFTEDKFPCELYICAPINKENDFIEVYHNELFKNFNIHQIGFIDPLSFRFRQIAARCSYMILPSCSEGMSGAVTTAMSAGIIPICSRECGFDDGDVINLDNCHIDTIKKKVIECANKPLDWIETECKKEVQLAKSKYSWNAFSNTLKDPLEKTLNRNGHEE